MQNYFDHVSGPDFKPAPKIDVIEFEHVAVPESIVVEERQPTEAEARMFARLRS